MWEKVSELADVLGDSIRPWDGLATNATTSPEPFLTFLSSKVHELLSQGGVIERDWPHATTGTSTGDLVSWVLGTASSPGHPEVLAARLVVDRWGAAAGSSCRLLDETLLGLCCWSAPVEEAAASSVDESELRVGGDRGHGGNEQSGGKRLHVGSEMSMICVWSRVVIRYSVTRLGEFWTFLGVKFAAKVAQKIANFWGYL